MLLRMHKYYSIGFRHISIYIPMYIALQLDLTHAFFQYCSALKLLCSTYIPNIPNFTTYRAIDILTSIYEMVPAPCKIMILSNKRSHSNAACRFLFVEKYVLLCDIFNMSGIFFARPTKKTIKERRGNSTLVTRGWHTSQFGSSSGRSQGGATVLTMAEADLYRRTVSVVVITPSKLNREMVMSDSYPIANN